MWPLLPNLALVLACLAKVAHLSVKGTSRSKEGPSLLFQVVSLLPEYRHCVLENQFFSRRKEKAIRLDE